MADQDYVIRPSTLSDNVWDITRIEDGMPVPDKDYLVSHDPKKGTWRCDCPGFRHKSQWSAPTRHKHVKMVILHKALVQKDQERGVLNMYQYTIKSNGDIEYRLIAENVGEQ